MDRATHRREFALLVGVNEYLPPGISGRRFPGSSDTARLRNLSGCVNDVQDIHGYLLRTLSDSIHVTALTSPLGTAQGLPTFENISQSFRSILQKTRAGDLFIFHFSGHGKRLHRTPHSPNEKEDPSLLTFDYCQGGRPIRGWEINGWLQAFHEQDVRILVLLDSCHSSGSWRDEDVWRTPCSAEWAVAPLNLLSDCERTDWKTPLTRGVFRGVSLERSWDINPEGFTLMAACEYYEKAGEFQDDNKHNGAFTRALLRNCDTTITYRSVCQRLATILRGQTPRVFGQDRLLFFGTTELGTMIPIPAYVEGSRIYMAIGKNHGIGPGAEFLYSPVPYHEIHSTKPAAETTVVANRVETVFSEITLPSSMKVPSLRWVGLIPSRWSLSRDVGDTFCVDIEPEIGDSFRESLLQALERRIVGPVQVTRQITSDGSKFGVRKRTEDAVDVHGPKWLIGYDGPVRGISFGLSDVEELSAALAHLGRFGQILSCKSSSDVNPPFSVTVEALASSRPVNEKRQKKVRYIFENKDVDVLYITLINLSSDYGIVQFYPSSETPDMVPSRHKRDFSFPVNAPPNLSSTFGDHREIIRTVVTRRKELNVLWRTIELPSVHAIGSSPQTNASILGQRPGRVEPSKPDLWVADHETFV